MMGMMVFVCNASQSETASSNTSFRIEKLFGPGYNVPVGPKDTVLRVERLLETMNLGPHGRGVPPHCQRLIVAGRLLQDTEVLDECGFFVASNPENKCVFLFHSCPTCREVRCECPDRERGYLRDRSRVSILRERALRKELQLGTRGQLPLNVIQGWISTAVPAMELAPYRPDQLRETLPRDAYERVLSLRARIRRLEALFKNLKEYQSTATETRARTASRVRQARARQLKALKRELKALTRVSTGSD